MTLQGKTRATEIDWDFIEKLEGGAATRGYIPKDRGSKVESGVTIATGLDLGQHSTLHLMRILPNDPEIVCRLDRYTLLKGAAAERALQSKPLILSEAEVKKVDSAVRAFTVRKVAERYHAGSGKNFFELPGKIQTAMISLIHNVGIFGAPKSFEALIRGDFKELAREIVRFEDKTLLVRRMQESMLVLQALGELEGVDV